MGKEMFKKKEVLDAWNNADPEGTASFYADNLKYRDPIMPKGIFSKADFIDYLKLIFEVWPKQKWVVDEIMPHSEENCYSVSHQFIFGNDQVEISGHGIDCVELENDLFRRNNFLVFRQKPHFMVVRHDHLVRGCRSRCTHRRLPCWETSSSSSGRFVPMHQKSVDGER